MPRDGYIGDSLLGAVRGVIGVTDAFLDRFAREVGDELLFLVVANSPVRTGRLKRSWRLDVRSGRLDGERVFEAKVRTGVRYAPEVEFGTGLYGPKHARYPIRPKTPGGWLSWVDPKTGKRQFRRLVMHPGSAGRQMVRLSLDEVGATLELKFERASRRWRTEGEVAMERYAKRHQVRS